MVGNYTRRGRLLLVRLLLNRLCQVFLFENFIHIISVLWSCSPHHTFWSLSHPCWPASTLLWWLVLTVNLESLRRHASKHTCEKLFRLAQPGLGFEGFHWWPVGRHHPLGLSPGLHKKEETGWAQMFILLCFLTAASCYRRDCLEGLAQLGAFVWGCFYQQCFIKSKQQER